MIIAVSYVVITVIPCDPQMSKQQALQETVIKLCAHFHIIMHRMMMSSFENGGSV